MNRDEALKQIKEVIENLSTTEQYYVYTEYCESNNDYDDMPYPCDEYTINDLCCGLDASDIIRRYGDINFGWDYVIFGIYGNEEWEGIEYPSDVAEWMLDNEYDCGISEIENIIDEYLESINDDDDDDDDDEE